MIFWILIIITTSGKTEYGYKFVEKSNCEKVGRDIGKRVKSSFKCKRLVL